MQKYLGVGDKIPKQIMYKLTQLPYMCSITTYMLKSNDGFVSSVTLIGLEIATTVHFIESIKQGCRIPGSGGGGAAGGEVVHRHPQFSKHCHIKMQ